MIELSGATDKLVAMALDACSLRHQAIAQNIANVNNPGYVPVKTSFSEQLSAVLASSKGSLDTASYQQLGGVQVDATADVQQQATDPRVALEMEMVKLAQNTVHYQALLKGLGKSTAILSMAINEGRR